jgi:hypothetical protein
MMKTFTVRRLAQEVLPDSDAERVDALMRQIDHWTLTGLYEILGAGPADVHVGRGKPRQYPAEALFWTALLYHMAGRGLLVLNMKQALQSLRKLDEKGDPAIGDAMSGKGPDVFLLMAHSRLALSYSLSVGSLAKADLGFSGTYFNLTQIFDPVRGLVRGAKADD